MNALELLNLILGAGKGSGLVAFLRSVTGDLAPKANEWADALEKAGTADLSQTVKDELKNIVSGHIDPRDNPSGAI